MILYIHFLVESIMLFSHELLSVFPYFGIDRSVKSSILLSMVVIYLRYLIIYICMLSICFEHLCSSA